MLFMAMFALKEEPEKKIFTRKELAASTMAALMKTTVGECGTMDKPYPKLELDLLEDCAMGKVTTDFKYSCEGFNYDTCSFLEEKIEALLSETLGQWNKRYHLKSRMLSDPSNYLIEVESTITTPGGNEVKLGCDPADGIEERDTSREYYLHTDSGLVESVLYICE